MREQVYYSDVKGNNLFGFRVEDDSMLPYFRKGDLLVVNPNIPARNGDFVVAIKDDACVLRLFVKGDRDMLVAASGETAPESASLYVLLGRVVERKKIY